MDPLHLAEEVGIRVFGLTNRTVVLAGGASGIGRAAARRFAELGADVVVLDIQPAMAQETVAAVEGYGRRGRFIETDVTRFEDVKRAVESVLGDFGRLDVLVNAVGWNEHSFFVQQTPEFWHKVMAINFWGQVHASRAAFPAPCTSSIFTGLFLVPLLFAEPRA